MLQKKNHKLKKVFGLNRDTVLGISYNTVRAKTFLGPEKHCKWEIGSLKCEEPGSPCSLTNALGVQHTLYRRGRTEGTKINSTRKQGNKTT